MLPKSCNGFTVRDNKWKTNLGAEDKEFTGIFENEKRHYFESRVMNHNHKRCYETFFQLHNNRSATFIAVLNLLLEQSAKIKQWAQFQVYRVSNVIFLEFTLFV